MLAKTHLYIGVECIIRAITSCFGKVCKHAALFELQAILGLGSGALTNSLGCVSNVLRVLRVPSLQSFRAPRPFAPFTELAILGFFK